MLKEDLLLQSIKCTTIDQLTKLIGDYLEQTVLIIDEKKQLISSNISQSPQIDDSWLLDGNLKSPSYWNRLNTFVTPLILFH
jgi:hypothetical protein